jgi:hypothetical protein
LLDEVLYEILEKSILAVGFEKATLQSFFYWSSL